MIKIRAIAKIAAFVVILTGVTNSFAQKTTVYIHNDADFKAGIELFQKEKFGAAQKCFDKAIKSHPDPQSGIRMDAQFYNAICAMELFNKDGEYFLKQFISEHPESPKVKFAYFYIGKYNYLKKKYSEAIDWFDKVDIYELTTEELAEFYFKRGYSNFSLDKFDVAKKDFYEIKDVDNKYAASAKYYYAHILYNEKNYETALKDFLKLQYNETFKTVVPFYIAQLYYLQGRYNDVISYAPTLTDSISSKRAPEIARIIGESYYQTSRYQEAIPYLKKYELAAGTLPRKDYYQLGYAYYKTKDYQNAIDYFVNATSVDNDTLAQNAFYHLGDCYLKTTNKQSARSAFGQASQLDYDKTIQEDALFIYAKLCYELAYNAYNEAVKAFQTYIKNFPNTKRTDEAYTYLVNVYITSKNYKPALDALDNIRVLTPELEQVYQKVAYYRGVELYNDARYLEAIDIFNKAVIYKSDKDITANAMYWMGESYYREKQYMNAIYSYTAYFEDPGSISTSEFSDANYNIGYCYFKMKDYKNSTLWFRKFVTFKTQADAKKINDALNRIGDGYFMMREFDNANAHYNESYKMKMIDADYALFQKALCEGLLKDYKSKIDDLLAFIENYSASPYIQKAKFELAETYLSDNQNPQALERFEKFISEYPNSLYINVCLSKIGLIYYNTKEDDKALATFDRLIKRDRKSKEANEAIGVVKAIYTAQGNVQKMEDYMSSIGAAIPQQSLDSIAFDIGKTHYLEQDCKTVISDFEKYIVRFPDGIFITEANFYKAECDYKLDNSDAALGSYAFVISKPKSQFTEQSLFRASEIVFKKLNYSKAAEYYKQLEQQAENPKNTTAAVIGLMRCNFQLKNYPDAVNYCNKVLALDKVSNELAQEAHYIIAQSLLAAQKYDEAMAEFRALSNSLKNEIGAEASYQVASILFMKQNYKQSEKTIFDFINSEGDYPYWVTKALILLADNYVAQNDNFQAKTTLKSIISESDIPELIKIAQEKMDKIIAAEEAAKQVKLDTIPEQLKFEGDTLEQKKLFTEPDTIQHK